MHAKASISLAKETERNSSQCGDIKMPTCAIITCKARSQTSSVAKGGVSFHRFPKELTFKLKWIEATGRKDWIPTKTSTICSKHFREYYFDNKKSGYKYLIEGAIPEEQIVNISSPAKEESSIKVLNVEEVNEKLCTSSNASTPKKINLEKIITSKDKIIQRQRKAIKTIRSQNRRLKKKISVMEEIINGLKK